MGLFLVLLALLISAIVYPAVAVLFFAIVIHLVAIMFAIDVVEWLAKQIIKIIDKIRGRWV